MVNRIRADAHSGAEACGVIVRELLSHDDNDPARRYDEGNEMPLIKYDVVRQGRSIRRDLAGRS